MKNFLIILFSAIMFVQYAFGQERVDITGSVKNMSGNAVPFAFIKNPATRQAIYSDSVGNFNIKLTPNTDLFISAAGYADAQINIATNTALQIIMQPAGTGQINFAAVANLALKPVTIGGYNDQNNQNFALRPGFNFFSSKKENAQGSPYLFDYWVHGFVINPQDSLIQRTSYLFNYDKIAGTVLLLQDNTTIGTIGPDQIKSITLFDNYGSSYILEKLPAVDNSRYVQVLSSGKKYVICKLIRTKLQKADYENNGITSRGNKFDSFIDEPEYYLQILPNGQPQKLVLKRKVLKTAFPGDAEKLQKYLSEHDGDIDDNFLKDLGDYLNQ